jgi:deazaflavin-dependent oxidoreductase (nitroreductase family)
MATKLYDDSDLRGPSGATHHFRLIATSSEVPMPTPSDNLKDRLSRSNEISLTVTGRKSGRASSRPVWFVLEDKTLYLLPVEGSDTQWYKNVLKTPSIRIGTQSKEAELKVTPLTDAKQVSSVVEKFRAKYGAKDVKKYYPKTDVAIVASLQ